MDSRALLALLFTVIVWGVAPVFLRTLSVDLGPASHLVIRYTLVSVAYLLGLALLGGWRIERCDWPRLLAVSVIGLTGYNLGSAFGFQLVPAGIGSLILGSQPLLIALLGTVIASEKLTIYAVAGLVVASAGTVLLISNDLHWEGGGASFLWGCTLMFVATAAFALYAVASKPLVRKYGAFSIAAMSVLLSAAMLVMLLARPSTIQVAVAMTQRNWLDMAYVLVFSTFICSITWNYGASRLPAATSGAFFYLMPVIGVFAGALLLGETLKYSTLIGGALILVGVAIVQFGPYMRRTRWRQADQ
jgi:drug/metabolite transporter (DMT)-like permease